MNEDAKEMLRVVLAGIVLTAILVALLTAKIVVVHRQAETLGGMQIGERLIYEINPRQLGK